MKSSFFVVWSNLAHYTFTVNQLQDLIALIVILVIGVVIGQLLGQDQQSIATALARERQAAHLYELSTGIFDKFYRVTAEDKITGIGPELSICKGIIEAHGGRIWAENASGCFIFNFSIPLTWEGALPQI